MATAVTYNGNSYSVPAYNDTGYAQGSGNMSSYLVALATGSLTLAGGAFTLTADANFGSNFGLIALYLKSVTANIATAGFLRMARTDLIEWRNVANGANLTLGVDGSNNLTWNSAILALTSGWAGSTFIVTTGGGTLTTLAPPIGIVFGGTASGTTLNNNRVMISSGGAIVEQAALGASKVLTTDVNGLPVGTTALAVANGGTNSSASLNNNRLMKSSGGAVIEAAAITASRAVISDANGIPATGTNTTNAAGYIVGTTIQTVVLSSTSATTSTGTGYTTTALSQAFTCLSSTSKLRVTVMGALGTIAGSSILASLFSDATDLSTTASGFASVNGATGLTLRVPCTIIFITAPGDTASHTYAWKIKSSSAASATWNIDGQTTTLTLEEIAA